MNKKLKISLIILGIIIIGLSGVSIFLNLTLKEKSIVAEPVEEQSGLDEISNQKTYQNEKYGYEISYPENYRMANSIMEKKGLEDESIKEESREKYSIEDFVVITNLSVEEEQEYLETCQNFYGGCYTSVNFPAGTITIMPFFNADADIEARIKDQELSGTTYGSEDSNLRIEKTKFGCEVRRWRHDWIAAYEMASIRLPEKIPYYSIYFGDEHRQYLDEIIIRMKIGDNYKKDLLVLDEIISSFRFISDEKDI